MAGMNSLVIRQQAGTLMEEAENLLKVMGQRALTSWEEQRVDHITDKVEKLLAEAVQLEEREGYRGVAKPQGLQRNGQFSNGRGTGNGYTRTVDSEDAIYLRAIRTGDAGALSELRASNDVQATIGTPATAGDAVPVGHFQGIIAKMRPKSLIDRLGLREIPGNSTSVNVPVDNEGDSGAFVATNELGAYDRDFPALDQVTLTLTKASKVLELSEELLADEDSKLLEYLSSYVASGMAYSINTAIVTEAIATATAALTWDSATAISAVEVPELLYKLPDAYMSGNVAWLMKRTTEGYLRGLFGTSQFSFGAQVGAARGNGGIGAELWGLPSLTDGAMPAIGASNKSIVFGDWSFMGYRLPSGMGFLRDPYSLSTTGVVRLLYNYRSAFKILQANAFVMGTHPSA